MNEREKMGTRSQLVLFTFYSSEIKIMGLSESMIDEREREISQNSFIFCRLRRLDITILI